MLKCRCRNRAGARPLSPKEGTSNPAGSVLALNARRGLNPPQRGHIPVTGWMARARLPTQMAWVMSNEIEGVSETMKEIETSESPQRHRLGVFGGLVATVAAAVLASVAFAAAPASATATATGTLTGTVTGPGGAALDPSASINVEVDNSDGLYLNSSDVAPDGKFTIEDAPTTGLDHLSFHDNGGTYSDKTVDIHTLVITDGGTTLVPTVELARAGVLTGHVTGPGGQALDADSTVHVEVYSGDNDLGYAHVGENGASAGEFRVTGLSVGTVTKLDIFDHGDIYASQTVTLSTPITITSGQTSVAPTVALTLAPTRPNSPAAPSGTPGDGQVALTWAAPANGGAAITDYTIQYWDGSTWKAFNDGVSANTSATVTGLTNGTGYLFRLSATNERGDSDFGPNSAVVTPALVVDQHVVGARVPAKIKRNNRRPVKLPAATDGGQRIAWVSATPKICKVQKGKLKLTGKRGVCRITAVAAAAGNFRTLRQAYAIRIR